jgi:hypothetical protein
MKQLLTKKLLLLGLITFSISGVILAQTQSPNSEFDLEAQALTTWTLRGTTIVTNGLGNNKVFNGATYNIISSAGQTLTLDTEFARIGATGNASNSARLVTITFPANGQPWNADTKPITSIEVTTKSAGSNTTASNNNTNSYQLNLDGTNAYNPALTFGGGNPNLASTFLFSDFSGVSPNFFNKTFSLNFDFKETFGFIDNIKVVYGVTRIPTSLVVTSSPTKTTYFPGEAFDPAGLAVRAIFNNDQGDFVDNYVNYDLLIPSGLLCQTTSSITVRDKSDTNITTNIPIVVSGGGYYAGLATNQGTILLANPRISIRQGEPFNASPIIVYGYLSCLSSGSPAKLLTERLTYDATGARGFKVTYQDGTPLTQGTTLNTPGTFTIKAIYSGTQAPNPDVALLPSPVFELTLSLEVVGLEDPVINETPLSETTFIGPSTNGYVETTIGGIDWHLVVESSISGTTVSYDETRGTKISGANKIQLISDPYNYLGDALIKSATFTLSTANLISPATLKLLVGRSYSQDVYSLSNGLTNVDRSFDQFPDAFNLPEALVGNAYGHLNLEVTNLEGGDFFLNIINVESLYNIDLFRAVQYAAFLREYATCDVEPTDVTDIENYYQTIFGNNYNPYLSTYYIYDRSSLDFEGNPFADTVSITDKYQYITNTTLPTQPLNSMQFIQSPQGQQFMLILGTFLISAFGYIWLKKRSRLA